MLPLTSDLSVNGKAGRRGWVTTPSRAFFHLSLIFTLSLLDNLGARTQDQRAEASRCLGLCPSLIPVVLQAQAWLRAPWVDFGSKGIMPAGSWGIFSGRPSAIALGLANLFLICPHSGLSTNTSLYVAHPTALHCSLQGPS